MSQTTPPAITLRPATAADISVLAGTAKQSFWETFTGLMPEEDLQSYLAEAFSPDQLHAEWNDPDSQFILVMSGPECAGYAKLSTRRRPERPEPEDYIEIDRLYLLKPYHGQKIGALLMEHCLHQAKTSGFTAIWLNVWERNTGSIAFYQRWGFELIDWTIRMRGNDPQKALWMRKLITTP